MTPTVQTLGDSTIDNIYWLLDGRGNNLNRAKKDCTEGKLQTKLGREYQVVSHAYDGFTTKDVLGERLGSIGSVLSQVGPKYDAYISFKDPNGKGAVNPLQELKNSLPSQGTHYVVISVGGNDFRENLTNPFQLIRDIPNVQKRYLQIVKSVQSLSTEERKIYPILMFQYRTDAKNDVYKIYKLLGTIRVIAFLVNIICVGLILVPAIQASAGTLTLKASMIACPVAGLLGLYLSHKAAPLSASRDIFLIRKPSMNLFGALLKRFYQPMLKEAREEQIPILDLSNTFNPYDNLYTLGIEPNASGSDLIAEGITHIVKNHNFGGESQIYASKGQGYSGLPNMKGWSVAYPKAKA